MDGTGLLFDPFIAALGPKFAATVVKYPARVALDYTQLEAIVRAALPTDHPYVILAESFSGPIAVSIAASAPPGLRGVVLCCSFVRNPRPALAALRCLAGAIPMTRAPISVVSHVMLGRFSTPALRVLLARAIEQVSAPVLRARIRCVLSVDAAAALAQVRVPVLYLRASHDRVVPAASAQVVLQHCPSATVAQIEAPHLLLQAAPTRAAALVAEFSEGLR